MGIPYLNYCRLYQKLQVSHQLPIISIQGVIFIHSYQSELINAYID